MNKQPTEKFFKAMAKRFGALSDATRLAILHCLMTHGEQNVSQIVAATGRTDANVSKHLRLLREAGLVARRKEGLSAFYRLIDPVVERVCRLVCDSIAGEMDES